MNSKNNSWNKSLEHPCFYLGVQNYLNLKIIQ